LVTNTPLQDEEKQGIIARRKHINQIDISSSYIIEELNTKEKQSL
jgi:hypothetical protein